MGHNSKQAGAAVKDRGTAAMLQRILARHEAELDARRSLLRNEITLDVADPKDSAEESSDQLALSLSASLLEKTGRAIHDIEDALRRLKTESFGICIDCASKIPLARLEALPFVETCRDCQERRDSEEAEKSVRFVA
jgi:DnaK suppressor protein